VTFAIPPLAGPTLLSWLTVLGIAKRIGAWLTSLSFWQIVSLGLAGLSLILWFQRNDARHDAAAYEKRFLAAKNELQRISTAKNNQKRETETRIATVKKQIRHADDQAKIIESAPLPGNCKTPPGVMGADL
jgi:hypothetical protein